VLLPPPGATITPPAAEVKRRAITKGADSGMVHCAMEAAEELEKDSI